MSYRTTTNAGTHDTLKESSIVVGGGCAATCVTQDIGSIFFVAVTVIWMSVRNVARIAYKLPRFSTGDLDGVVPQSCDLAAPEIAIDSGSRAQGTYSLY